MKEVKRVEADAGEIRETERNARTLAGGSKTMGLERGFGVQEPRGQLLGALLDARASVGVFLAGAQPPHHQGAAGPRAAF